MNSWTVQMVSTDEFDIFVFEPCTKERASDHGEGNLHQVGVDIDRPAANLLVEVGLSDSATESCMMVDSASSCLRTEALLDEATLGLPRFTMLW